MQRAAASAVGLPSRSTSAPAMLGLVTPPDVRRSFTNPPIHCDGTVKRGGWNRSWRAPCPTGGPTGPPVPRKTGSWIRRAAATIQDFLRIGPCGFGSVPTMPIKLENVGIAVHDLEATIAFFTDLGLTVLGR